MTAGRWLTARAGIAVTVVVLMTACGGQPTTRQAAKERDRLASAAITGDLIAAAWDAAAVPGVYASHSLGKLGADFEATAAAPVWQALPAPVQHAMRGTLTAIAGTISALDSAITRHDRAGVAEGRRELGRERTRLHAVRIDTSGT